MKKILNFVTLLLIINLTAVGQTTSNTDANFNFYKSIPLYENISLSGQDIDITIYPNYTVKVSASKRDNYCTATLTGTGSVSYDLNTKSLFLEIKGNITGSYYRSEDVYRTEKEYNVGSTTMNILFGSGTSKTYTYSQVYDHTDYYQASCNEIFTCELPLKIKGSTYELNYKEISARLTGNTSTTVSFSFRSGAKTLSYGTKKTQQNVATDEFGKWQWNSDKTNIYLESDNIPNCKLYIVNTPDNPLQLCFYFGGSTVSGKSSSKINDGSSITTFGLCFEDSSTSDLSFALKNANNPYYFYVNYNRFTEQKSYDANSIISQLAAKKTLMISYSANGSSYLGMFSLEGLETILSYIK